MASKQEFKTRRAEPGTTFGYTSIEGEQKTFRADDEGLVTPKNDAEEAIVSAYDLPVARVETASKPAVSGKGD